MAGSNVIASSLGRYDNVLTNLAPSTAIGAGTTFSSYQFGIFHGYYTLEPDSNVTAAGAGWAGVTGYIGFKDTKNGHEYYGWAKITTNSDATTVTLDGLAFNATPGASILAGQTSSIPEPANAAALLALGAAGLVLYRQRKNLSRAAA